MTHESTPAVLGLSEGLGPNETLVERLRQERRPTAWTRGLDVDYPTAWEPNLLCHEAAAEIVRLRCLVEAVRGAFNRECDDTDEILRGQGLEPANCRTDGGSLKLQMVLGADNAALRREAHSWWTAARDALKLREPLAPEAIEAAAAEAFGYEGGLQEVNLGDLLHFARVLEQRHGIGA